MMRPSSDYYQIRRGWIRDGCAGFGFLIGFIGAGPYGWPAMHARVQAGEMGVGVLRFFGVLMLGGLLVGVAGLIAGAAIAFVWETLHRAFRRPPTPDRDDRVDGQSPAPPRPVARRQDAAYAIRYDGPPVTADEFVALATRVWPRDYDVTATAAALTRTTNIGARHDGRLVGAVRVLDDGYLFATVPELMVDPDYRGMGVGRELMRRALDGASRGALFFGAQRESVRFFERIGAERGPTGFVLRRDAAARLVLFALLGSDVACSSKGDGPTAPGACTTVALAVGEVSAILSGSSVCVGAGTQSATYVLVPFLSNTSPSAKATVTFSATGTTTASTAAAAASAVPPAASRLRRSTFEAGLRRRERSLAPLMPAARRWAGVGAPRASRSTIPSVVSVGDMLQLNANGEDNCANPLMRTGRVAAVTTRAIVVTDIGNPAGGYTDAELQSFGVTFDTLIDPLDRLNFGDPADIDENGRVLIFFTRAVNDLTVEADDGFIAGFFTARDLYPTQASGGMQSCATSNVGEMFYMLVPDPVRGGEFSKANASSIVLSTLVHEYQHLINASRRLYINTAAEEFEEVWLNEGLSHIAEELLFYRVSGLTPRSNIDVTAIRQAPARLDAFNRIQIANVDRYIAFLEGASRFSPFSENDSLETRGATWSYLRFAVDHGPVAEPQVWRSLANSVATGVVNLQQVLGVSAVSIARDWSLSVVADDLTATSPTYAQPSWNMRDIVAELTESATFPLQTFTLRTTTPVSVALVPGGAAYVSATVAAGATATLSWSTLPTGVSVSVVRTR